MIGIEGGCCQPVVSIQVIAEKLPPNVKKKCKGVEDIPKATLSSLFVQFLNSSLQAVMLLSVMREVSSSNIGRETKNTQTTDLPLFYSGKCQNGTINYGWIALFHALSASAITIIISVCAAWYFCTSGFFICVNEGRVADIPGELYLKDQIDCCLCACFAVFNGLSKQTNLKRRVPVYRIILGHSCCSPRHSA
jgi:hypothetical protein